MKPSIWLVAAALSLAPLTAEAQVAVTPAADQLALLKSPDPILARNKRLVFDLWRTVLEAGQADRAPDYLAEGYIQHNPMVATGRAAFMKFFSGRPAKPVSPTIAAPLVSIVAERDMVVLSFVRSLPDPADPAKTYTTTWFDMFRIEDGKVAEHWDTATKR
ncbi:MAG: nuclear transport factor 2 family protein [Phenylobacterium sp.]